MEIHKDENKKKMSVNEKYVQANGTLGLVGQITNKRGKVFISFISKAPMYPVQLVQHFMKIPF